MKVACVGGGPAGLYFAISMKLRDPKHQITVIERNRPNDTFGWGVVFSDQTMDNLRANDKQSADTILNSFAHWDDIDVYFKGAVITSSGHGFCGMGRMHLLNILQERCYELGVDLVFEKNIDDIEELRQQADLVIASDGLNSVVRKDYGQHFLPSIDTRKNKFVWLGTHQLFEAFTFVFKETELGMLWAHAYRFDKDTSAFIVECSKQTWDAIGFEFMEKEESVRYCEKVFEDYLDGHALMSNAEHLRGSAIWINFPRVVCEKWYHDNIVLLGDAAHTAHFSIGSGTKLAFEDAIHLADVLHEYDDRQEALENYQQARSLEVMRITSAARNSTEWFEDLSRYTHLEPIQFAYALLTRSQRVSHENLRLRDNAWLQGVEQWFARQANFLSDNQSVRPLFVPYKLRDMELANRVVVSPMSMYSAEDGVPTDFHLVHYGSRAQGGAGLLFTEMTDVAPEARITRKCAGLWNDEQEQAWKRIVEFVHDHSTAKFAIQLGHAGPKGATKLPWESSMSDEPLESGGWKVIAPSATPFAGYSPVPRTMTRDDMEQVIAQFVESTKRAERCGFDMLELHAAHGYLISAYITPLLNQRNDEYGGSLGNRLRFPLEVFRAMRAAWPEYKPMSVRISATDWHERGITESDAVEIARAFSVAGADIIDVSAGQTSADAKPVYGRMFQTPFAARIKNETGIATMAVGNIYEVDHVNSILVSGRADLCCLARPHLSDPYWTLHAAADMNYADQHWPVQYDSAKEQYQRNLDRAKLMAEQGLA